MTSLGQWIMFGIVCVTSCESIALTVYYPPELSFPLLWPSSELYAAVLLSWFLEWGCHAKKLTQTMCNMSKRSISTETSGKRRVGKPRVWVPRFFLSGSYHDGLLASLPPSWLLWASSRVWTFKGAKGCKDAKCDSEGNRWAPGAVSGKGISLPRRTLCGRRCGPHAEMERSFQLC